MLLAYALWSGAFNRKRSFSITPAAAEQTKIQRDFRYQDNIYGHILLIALSESPEWSILWFRFQVEKQHPKTKQKPV